MTALDARIVVIVGPEGGLTSDEVNLVLSSHPRSYAVSLGPSIFEPKPLELLHQLWSFTNWSGMHESFGSKPWLQGKSC